MHILLDISLPMCYCYNCKRAERRPAALRPEPRGWFSSFAG